VWPEVKPLRRPTLTSWSTSTRAADELKALLGREVDVVSTGGLKRRDDGIRAEAVDL
jgi:predicted nucleotidyltransferase